MAPKHSIDETHVFMYRWIQSYGGAVNYQALAAATGLTIGALHQRVSRLRRQIEESDLYRARPGPTVTKAKKAENTAKKRKAPAQSSSNEDEEEEEEQEEEEGGGGGEDEDEDEDIQPPKKRAKKAA